MHSVVDFMWPQLERVTLNLYNRDIRFYLTYTERQANNSLTCCIHRNYLEMWTKFNPIELAVLHSICTMQEIPREKDIKEAFWPFRLGRLLWSWSLRDTSSTSYQCLSLPPRIPTKASDFMNLHQHLKRSSYKYRERRPSSQVNFMM